MASTEARRVQPTTAVHLAIQTVAPMYLVAIALLGIATATTRAEASPHVLLLAQVRLEATEPLAEATVALSAALAAAPRAVVHRTVVATSEVADKRFTSPDIVCFSRNIQNDIIIRQIFRDSRKLSIKTLES